MSTLPVVCPPDTGIERFKQLETNLLRANRSTAEALTMLETLLANAPVGLGFVDREFRILRMNDRLAADNGLAIADQLGRTVAEAVPKLWPQLEPLYRHVLETGEAILDNEVSGVTAADPLAIRHWLTSYYPVSVDDEVIGIGIVVLDITERRKVEEARRQLAIIVDGSGDAIFGVTNEGLVKTWNAAAEQLFGYTAAEIVGQSITLLTPVARVAEQASIRARVIAGGHPERLETTRCRKDGSSVEVLMTLSPIADESGAVLGLSVISHDISERRSEQNKLETSLHQLAEAQRVTHFGSVEFDLVTGVITRSEEFCRILGLDPALERSSEQIISMIHPVDRPAASRAFAGAVERGIPFDTVCRILRPDGEQRWIHLRVVPEVANDGAVVKVMGTVLDETERIEAARVHRSAEARFEIGFQQAGIGALIVDLRGVPIRVNAAVEALLGRTEAELVGHLWTAYTHPDETPLAQIVLERVAAGHDTYEDERRYVRPDATVVWASVHVSLVRDESGKPEYFYSQLQDITERKQMEKDLSHQALHDSLTGLPNRALLTDRLLQKLSRARKRATRVGLIFLNVDHFKQINEAMGHATGDDLLRLLAERIVASIRPGDTVARLGGDEFVVVCDNVSVVTAGRIAERIVENLSQPCLLAGQQLRVSASLGIALADDETTPDSLLRDGDAAMRRAKERGRARIELYDDALRSKAQRRVATATALRQALERDEFVVHYQPVVDLSTGAMVSAEALVRWQHPDRGIIQPAEFIPLAEDIGLIVPIGAFALEQACRQLVEWQRTEPSMSVAVNLSVRQMLVPDIASVVQDILTRTGTPPGSLCLELTESVFMDDVDYFGATLSSLKSLGVKLSIDDFGTGYSSLSYLKQFPVDAIKVDRGFINGLGGDTHDTALVAAVIAMAAALGLEVTAEGVETRSQLLDLKMLQCERAQGYYLARPMPADAISKLIADSHHWRAD